MGREIERKFLVTSKGYRKDSKKVRVVQGYLSLSPTVRIRTAGNKAWLTVKGKSKGITRLEFEYPVPFKEAKKMLALCEGPLIVKDRWYHKYKGKLWEIDEFHGANEGLVVAEIELVSEKAPFAKPDWVGREVSSDHRYTNTALVKHPHSNWHSI